MIHWKCCYNSSPTHPTCRGLTAASREQTHFSCIGSLNVPFILLYCQSFMRLVCQNVDKQIFQRSRILGAAVKPRHVVIHPASIEISARDRVKTDKRDAVKIAIQLSVGRLKGINIPSEEREGRRQITRLRETIMNSRKATGNKIKNILFQHGLIKADDDRKVSKRWIEEVLEISIDENIDYW